MSTCSEQARQLDAWFKRSDPQTIAKQGNRWAEDCIRSNCESNLLRLLDAGIDIEQRDTLDRTLLDWACYHGSLGCIRLLLKRGANPDNSNSQPILMALAGGQDAAALVMLEHVLPRNREEEYRWASEAISRGCPRTLAWFIDQGYPLNHPDAGFSTLLEWAARVAGPDMLQQLVDAGAEVDVPGYKARTPLMSAIEMGKLDNAHWLLDHGADPGKRTAAGGPLDMLGSVLSREDTALTKRLQVGAGKAASTPSAVRAAAQSGQAQTLELLLQHSDDIDAQDGSGETALHKACRRCSEASVALLLRKGASTEVCNRYGETPMVLLWQVYSDRAGCLHQLLLGGADPRAMRRSLQPACFVSQLAAVCGEPALVQALHAQAVQFFPLAEDPVDWDAHHSAAELVAALLGKRASDVHAWVAANQLTPVRLAEAVEADPRRVLFAAIELDARRVVSLLLDGGVALEIGDGDNNTPLNIAARYDRIEIARDLLARGADAQARTERGTRPIGFAESDAMRELLRQHGG